MINHNGNFPNLDGIENGRLIGVSAQCLMVDWDSIIIKRKAPPTFPTPLSRNANLYSSDLHVGIGCRGFAPPSPEMTCGFLIQLVFCQKKKKTSKQTKQKIKNYVVYPLLRKIPYQPRAVNRLQNLTKPKYITNKKYEINNYLF